MTIETGGNEIGTSGEMVGENQSEIMSLLGHMGTQHQEIQTKTSQHDEVLSKLEKVFSKQEANEDWYEEVLKTALEAEKKGAPIPLTVKISTELKNSQEQNAKLMRELQELKSRQDLKDNPSFQADQIAYNNIDTAMGQELKKMYGDNIPKSVAVGLTQDLVEKIRWEQTNNPQRWAAIRSDPGMMRQIVRNAVSQTVPQHARQIISENETANATYEPNEIRENIAEAQALLRDPDVRMNPSAVNKINESIVRMREMLWESMLPGQNRRSRV